MQFGVRAHDYGKYAPEELFGLIAADGFSAVQLAPKKSIAGVEQLSDITPALLAQVGAQLEKNRLTVAVYGSYVELGLADEPKRVKQAGEFRAQIANAKALGAGCIASETTSVEKQPQASREQALVALRRSLEEILPEAERLNVVVAIEPVASHTLHTPEAAAALVRELQSPWLRLLFDPVNLLTADQLATQRDLWARAFDCMGEHIAAVHIKGTRMGASGALEKCGLLDSQVDWVYLAERLRALNNTLPVLREEAVPAQAKSDIEYMRGLFG